MTIKSDVISIINNNDVAQATHEIAVTLKIATLSEIELTSVLYFAILQSELKAKASVAKLFASKAESILHNIEMLSELIPE